MAAPATGAPRRIGIFGGTFDPPHIGHLVAALEARAALSLDRVFLTVANRPWQKVDTRPITGARRRLEMVRAAVAGLDGLEASDVEIRRGGDSYTADTLAQLRDENPGAEFFVVLGADAAAGVHTWERVDEVFTQATVVAVTRADPPSGRADDDPGGNDTGVDRLRRVRMPRLDVSSTELRDRVATGRGIDVLCPAPVVAIIDAHGLYRVGNP